MIIKNEVMLITYADSLGENLSELKKVTERYLDEVIGGIHLLPFFPSTGDRGFAPTTYQEVEKAFGDWTEIESLGERYYLMFDFMVNHISKQSEYFQDYQANHKDSQYKDMFIDVAEFYPEGHPSQEDIDLIYKRKDKAPFQEVRFDNGETGLVWNTFGEEQIDLDVRTEVTRNYIKNTLKEMAGHKASVIRLDAFAYAIKKLNTNCFFIEPDIWDLLDSIRVEAEQYGMEILPEIHEHYSIQMKLAEHDYFIYDFALPMLVLHALYSGRSERIANWLKMSPMKQFTTLDTHDGIGVVDAKDLLTDDELEYTSEELYKVGANVKKIYSSEKYNNLDIYQINSTYYSALGDDDRAYLLARALQVFAPGIPQVYYVGLLAGQNDIELLEKTKEGRDINRHYFSLEEIERETQRPVVQSLFSLLKFRNKADAFDLEGTIEVVTPSENTIVITRVNRFKSDQAVLEADLANKQFKIWHNQELVFEQV